MKTRFVILPAVLSIFLLAGHLPGTVADNIGSVFVLRGLARDDRVSFVKAEAWLEQAGNVDNLNLARLGLLNPTTGYSAAVRDLRSSPRGQVLQTAAVRFVLRRVDEAQGSGRVTDERTWRSLAAELIPQNVSAFRQEAVALAGKGELTEAITRYEIVVGSDQANWQDFVRLVVLNQKAGRAEEAEKWHQLLFRRFPNQDLHVLRDLTDPFAQISCAEALAYFGFLDDAIAVGERSVAANGWDWGHRVVAGFYQLKKQYPEAERHLLEALKHPSNQEIVLQYQADLARLYAEEGQSGLSAAH